MRLQIVKFQIGQLLLHISRGIEKGTQIFKYKLGAEHDTNFNI
jgi:hypothetical protein